MNLYLYCRNIDDDFSSRLDVSNDGHHEEIEPKNLKKLMAFRFTGKKTNDDGARFDNGQFTAIINQGRGAELWNRELKLSGFEFYETAINETTFYMNVNGDILGDCNLSYESQDALKVANVNDKGFSPMKAAEKWNKIIDVVENTAVENVIESISAVV